MFRKPNDKNYHLKLLEDMKSVNIVTDTGVCFGYAVMGLSAILLRDTPSFDRRMMVLHERPADELAGMMRAAEKPSDVNESLNTKLKRQFYIDMQAFLSGVSMYQNLRPYKHLFNEKAWRQKHNIQHVSSILLPQKLVDCGGLALAANFYSVYSVPELMNMLQSLNHTLRASYINHPVGFLVRSSNHALTFGFDARYNCWLYMEVHDGVTQMLDDKRMAEKIHAAFSDNDYTAMSVSAYTAGHHAKATTEILLQWRQDSAYRESHNMSLHRIKSSDSSNTSLLFLAVDNNDVSRVSTLLKSSHVCVNQQTSAGISPLHQACTHGYADCVKLLLSHHDTDANLVTSGDGLTPLHIAIQQDYPAVVHELLQHKKTDANACRKDGYSVLHIAAFMGKANYLEELLAHGADVNLAAPNGVTALHYAVQSNSIDCVKILLKQPGLDIDSANHNGTTALMTAVAMNHLDIAKEILLAFPYAAGTVVKGMSAYDVTMYNNDKRMKDLLDWFMRSYPAARLSP